jgi:hypothetical protein
MGVQQTPPHETLAIAASWPNSKSLATHVVLAHPRVAFHHCTCGLHGGAATVAAALIGYGYKKVAAGTSSARGDCDRLLPLHRRATTLACYSNSSNTTQRI